MAKRSKKQTKTVYKGSDNPLLKKLEHVKLHRINVAHGKEELTDEEKRYRAYGGESWRRAWSKVQCHRKWAMGHC